MAFRLAQIAVRGGTGSGKRLSVCVRGLKHLERVGANHFAWSAGSRDFGGTLPSPLAPPSEQPMA